MSQTFDVIFAGGGTTACIIAGRLATIDPSLTILVIESGQHSRDLPRHVQPCRYVEHLAPDSTTLSHYVAKPSAHLNGRSAVVSCGRGVGGGSTVNFMFYVRGAASDYDDWAAFGNKGWSFNELLPFVKKLETFNPIADRLVTHGYSGPINVSASGIKFGLGDQFLNVATAYDPDRPQVDDNNDFVTGNAYSPPYLFVDPTGKRSDTASRYLYPHANNPNVTILTEKHVKRVVVENGRAVAVEYATDPKGTGDGLATAKANKLIVLSSGAFGSPMILERSGIGSRSVLEKNDVRVQVDLPGVGENYQDHLCVLPAFYASDEVETMADVWYNSEKFGDYLKEWEEHGTGKIAHNGAEVLLKMRPTETQLSSSGKALQHRWEAFFKHVPDKSMAVVALCAGFPHRPLVQSMLGQNINRKIFSSFNCILHPESVGSVHITSGDVLDSPPDLDAKFLTEEGDIAQFTLLYKFVRELIRRMPAYRGEVAVLHPKFPTGSPAACNETAVPVPIDAPDIVYSDADDEAIANFHRDRAIVSWHSLGTCAMKPRNQGGVVDARLNVYGVTDLKVADMSICPSNVGNNTYSTALLIGEKAASIIAEDLGYKNA